MSSEILSTARPSGLRLLGSLTVVIGAALAGVGALLDWVTIGFPEDVGGKADVAVKGTDVWEGKLVLAVAVASLIALIVMRVATSPVVRSAIAVAIATGGVLVAAVVVVDASRATQRFGGGEGLTDIAEAFARQLGQPVEPVRALLEQNFGATVRVDVVAGMPLALVGGLMLVAGGGLSLAWVRRRRDEPDIPRV